jgi:hypothetical protein
MNVNVPMGPLRIFCTVSAMTPLGKGVSSVDPFSSHVTVSTGLFACELIMHVKVTGLLMAATKDQLGISNTREMQHFKPPQKTPLVSETLHHREN